MRAKFVLILLLVVGLMVGCGEEEPVAVEEATATVAIATQEPTKPAEPTEEPQLAVAPTDAPVPTNTPLPEPTSTPEPEPTDESSAEANVGALVELVRIDAAGVSVRVPAGYSVQVFGDSAEIAPPDATDPTDGAFSISGSLYEEGETFASIRDEISGALGDFNEVGEPQPFDIAIGEAFYIDFAHEEDGTAFTGRAIIIDQQTQAAALFGLAGTETWSSLGDTFDDIARSVTFFEPVASTVNNGDGTDDATPIIGGATSDGQNDGEQLAAEVVGESGTGMACFSARGNGLTCLHPDSTWQQITEDNSPIGSDYIVAMGECNGTILMAHLNGLSRYDGSSWREYDDGWGFSTAEDVACDANDDIWLAHFEGVSHFDGESWMTFSADDILAGESLVYEVEIAPDGTLWALASGAIAQYNGNNWTTFSENDGFADRYFFEALAFDADGTVWAAHSSGLLYYENGAWFEVDSPSFLSPETLVVTADGRKWVGTFNDGVVIFEGPTTSRINHANDGLSSDGINAMHIDEIGRLWVGTEYGLNIWDGAEWTIYHMDNSDIAHNLVDSLAVTAGGPALPPNVDKANGSMSGTLLAVNGSPLATTSVEICVEPIYGSYETFSPCSEQPTILQAESDENGQFTFADVPVGNYALVVETADGWVEVEGQYGVGFGLFPVRSAEMTDLGEVTVELDQ